MSIGLYFSSMTDANVRVPNLKATQHASHIALNPTEYSILQGYQVCHGELIFDMERLLPAVQYTLYNLLYGRMTASKLGYRGDLILMLLQSPNYGTYSEVCIACEICSTKTSFTSGMCTLLKRLERSDQTLL